MLEVGVNATVKKKQNKLVQKRCFFWNLKNPYFQLVLVCGKQKWQRRFADMSLSKRVINIFALASSCNTVEIRFHVHPENFTSAFFVQCLPKNKNNVDNSDDLNAVTSIHSRHMDGYYSTNNSVKI